MKKSELTPVEFVLVLAAKSTVVNVAFPRSILMLGKSAEFTPKSTFCVLVTTRVRITSSEEATAPYCTPETTVPVI